MRFQDAVATVSDLSGAYCSGLQALRERDRNRIDCNETRRLTGSVNVEDALRGKLPHAPLWDYGVGWKAKNGDQSVWVEVHDANSLHVANVIKKAKWLRGWLRENGATLMGMTRRSDGYVWIASGRVVFQKNSPQARQLAASGVSFPRERPSLP